ncbi:hypothetical protein B0T14DRAFT_151056 [Immersiella caudata]|uniref:Uncharacterized protein n=1 Tax=Immersiella caudata TaxID=314043 RepID=A0AA39WW27_9PEZI|nr:hypothetical protein B0T14DRAFT_151056 [Immersiella caudata]
MVGDRWSWEVAPRRGADDVDTECGSSDLPAPFVLSESKHRGVRGNRRHSRADAGMHCAAHLIRCHDVGVSGVLSPTAPQIRVDEVLAPLRCHWRVAAVGWRRHLFPLRLERLLADNSGLTSKYCVSAGGGLPGWTIWESPRPFCAPGATNQRPNPGPGAAPTTPQAAFAHNHCPNSPTQTLTFTHKQQHPSQHPQTAPPPPKGNLCTPCHGVTSPSALAPGARKNNTLLG